MNDIPISKIRNVILFIIVIIFLLALIPPIWTPTDVAIYMRMVEGEWVELPFRMRPLIPLIIGFIGGSYTTFVAFNFVLFSISMYIYSRIYGVGAAALFFVGAYFVLNVVIQTPMLEAGIIFSVICALWISDKEQYVLTPIIMLLSFAIHPVAFVLVIMIILTDKRLIASEPVVLPAVAIMGIALVLSFMSGDQGTMIMQPIEVYDTIILTVGIFWVGFVHVNDVQPEGYRAIFALVICCGFALVGTYTAKMVYYVGLFLAPLMMVIYDDFKSNVLKWMADRNA